MSCDAVSAAAVLWLAAVAPGGASPMTPEQPPMPAGSVALEPLFADIVKRAGELKAEVQGFQAGKAVPGDFGARIAALAELDMKGHVLLAERGTDGDLKCILRGIAEDLPEKLKAMQGAGDAQARAEALTDMAYLLNDNVEVITTPPRADSMSGT